MTEFQLVSEFVLEGPAAFLVSEVALDPAAVAYALGAFRASGSRAVPVDHADVRAIVRILDAAEEEGQRHYWRRRIGRMTPGLRAEWGEIETRWAEVEALYHAEYEAIGAWHRKHGPIPHLPDGRLDPRVWGTYPRPRLASFLAALRPG